MAPSWKKKGSLWPGGELDVFKSQRQLVAPWPGCVGVNGIDAFVVDDTGGVVGVDGGHNQFHFCRN